MDVLIGLEVPRLTKSIVSSGVLPGQVRVPVLRRNAVEDALRIPSPNRSG